MEIGLYVIGYLVIAWGVAKLYIKKSKHDHTKTIDEIKEDAVFLGIAWIVSVPLAILAVLVGGIIFDFLEFSKRTV